MAVSSMTGFARADGGWVGQNWTWEIKSVNGRGLELRFRLPPGMEPIEVPARSLAAERLRRGNISISLHLGPSAAAPTYRLNAPLLRRLAEIVHEAESMIEAAPARLDGLLALRGVMEVVEPQEDEKQRAGREAALLQSFASGLDRLVAARAAEGAKLTQVLTAQLGNIEKLVGAAGEAAGLREGNIKARLREQVASLLETMPGLPEERLAQELALIAVRSDVREELDRLTAHVAAAREIIAKGDPGGAGRRLDFLAQEFNREANTLCSKSGDVALTQIGLDLKLTIDRLREQVQNIE